MLETFAGHFQTIFSVFATLIGAVGLAIALSQWIGAELLGKPLKVNGVEKAIDWSDRGHLAIFVATFGCLTALGIWLFSADWVAFAYVSLLTSIPFWTYLLFVPLIWLVVTLVLNRSAGWPELMRSFSRPTGKALFTQKLPWAVMGRGVTCKNVITIAAHDAGVTVEQNRLFGLFNRPVLIPWEQLTVEASGGAAPDLVRLGFGELETAELVMPLESWEAIERHRPEKQP